MNYLEPESEYKRLEENYKYFKRFLSKKDRPKKPSNTLKKKSKRRFLEDNETTYESRTNPSDDLELRDVMINEIKRNLMKNQYYTYTEEESSIEAKNLERKIRFKLKNPSKYEKIFEKIINFLRKIRKANYRNISIFLKNFEFKPKFIGRLASKKDSILKKIEKKLGKTKLKKRKKPIAQIISDDDKKKLYKPKIKKLKRYDKDILEKNRALEENGGISSKYGKKSS